MVLVDKGEMAELVESARLEIECTAKSSTVGSNPTLSAMKILLFAKIDMVKLCKICHNEK